jgi:hypothetical protein
MEIFKRITIIERMKIKRINIRDILEISEKDIYRDYNNCFTLSLRCSSELHFTKEEIENIKPEEINLYYPELKRFNLTFYLYSCSQQRKATPVYEIGSFTPICMSPNDMITELIYKARF